MAILNIALRYAADTYRDRPAQGAPVRAGVPPEAPPVSAKTHRDQHPAVSGPPRNDAPSTAGTPRSLRLPRRSASQQASAPATRHERGGDGSEWRAHAECGPGDTELFFSKDPMEKRAALAICNDCPVARECLAEAMAQERGVDLHGRYGIRGGTTPVERRELSRAMSQRPVKTGRVRSNQRARELRDRR